MDITPKKIMDALQSGLSQQEMVTRFPAESLTSAEMEDLFAKAKLLGRSQMAHRLLVYLIQVSKDDWFNVRILALLVQHADSAQDQTGRLVAMRKILDHIAKALPENGDQFSHYQKLNAFYYVLAARSRRDVGDMDRALNWYETALGIYKGLGLDASVEKVVQELQALHMERRAFALTSASRQAADPDAASLQEDAPSDMEESAPAPADDVQPPPDIQEPEALEDQPTAEAEAPSPQADWSAHPASEAVPTQPRPEPLVIAAAPLVAELQSAPEPEPEAPLPLPPEEPLLAPPAAPVETPPPVSAVDNSATFNAEIQALRSQRDSLQMEVQDLGQQGESLQAQVAKAQKRLKGLETRVKEQQRILEEKQALLQQIDRLSEQEARLRQSVAQLEQQEQDQTRKLEILYNEARLLEKQVDVLKRHTAPLIPLEQQASDGESS